MHDKNIASSIKGTILNVNRRFDKLKTTLPQKHKKLKQLQRLVHNVTTGLDETATWAEQTAKLLEKNLLFENFEEVKNLHVQYETQMVDYKKHADKMKAKNNACSQIENILGEEGLQSYKEQIGRINERWKVVQEHAETQHAKVRHVYVTWERFENALVRLRGISQSSNEVWLTLYLPYSGSISVFTTII
jgi:ATP-dependent exoDNAse (exonuclease V) beta subunit